MAEHRYFAYKIVPYRPNFAGTATDEEKLVVGKHFNYLKELLEKNILVHAGRTDGGDFGLAIFECGSMEEAQELTKNDPAVKAGIFIPEVFEYYVALHRDVKED